MILMSSLSLTANGSIDGVDFRMEVSDAVINIEEVISFSTVSGLNHVKLKLLSDYDSQVTIDSLSLNNKSLAFEITDLNPVLEIKLPLEEVGEGTIEVYYHIESAGDVNTIPVFFTDLAASNSDSDFFDAEFQWDQNDEIRIRFPSSNYETSLTNGKKISRLELPALPSMIKLQRGFSQSGPDVNEWVDWGVAIIFLFIGGILWKFRRKLSYG